MPWFSPTVETRNAGPRRSIPSCLAVHLSSARTWSSLAISHATRFSLARTWSGCVEPPAPTQRWYLAGFMYAYLREEVRTAVSKSVPSQPLDGDALHCNRGAESQVNKRQEPRTVTAHNGRRRCGQPVHDHSHHRKEHRELGVQPGLCEPQFDVPAWQVAREPRGAWGEWRMLHAYLSPATPCAHAATMNMSGGMDWSTSCVKNWDQWNFACAPVNRPCSTL